MGICLYHQSGLKFVPRPAATLYLNSNSLCHSGYSYSVDTINFSITCWELLLPFLTCKFRSKKSKNYLLLSGISYISEGLRYLALRWEISMIVLLLPSGHAAMTVMLETIWVYIHQPRPTKCNQTRSAKRMLLQTMELFPRKSKQSLFFPL